MAYSPNIDRLKKFLKNFTIDTSTFTTANVTNANITNISGSSSSDTTLNVKTVVNKLNGAGPCATSTTGSNGEAQILGIQQGTSTHGFYTYQEEVSIVGTLRGAIDQTCIAQLSKKLPANSKIISAGLTTNDRSQVSDVLVGLALDNDTVSQGAVLSSPTEIISDSVGSGALSAGSGGTDDDSEAYGGAPLDVGANVNLYLCTSGTGGSEATGSVGSVLVTLNYYGSGPPTDV